jgi:hypothetical protein
VVHGSGWDSSAISVIDLSTGRSLTTFGFGSNALSSMGTRGTWQSARGRSGLPCMGQTRSSSATPPPASCSTGSPSQSRPHWPWTARRCGWPASMDGCAASMSTPARFGCVPPPSWSPASGLGRGLWPMTFDGKVLRLDRRTGRVVARVSGTFKAADLAVGAEGVWVYDQRQGAVVRIDPRTTGLSGPSGRSASRWWSPTPASLRSGTGRSGWSARAVRPLSGSTRTADPAGPVLGLRRPS